MVAIVSLLAAVTGGLVSSWAMGRRTRRSVITRQIVAVDADGRERAILDLAASGEASFALLDECGRIRVLLSAGNDGGDLTFFNHDGSVASGMMPRDGGGTKVFVADEAGGFKTN